MPIREKKELSLSYLLWCLSFVGVCGVQRMYLGQVGYGMVLLFTLGLCGIGQLLDLFLLPDSVKQANRGLKTADPAHDAAAVSTHHAAPFSLPAGNSQADDGELDQLLRAAQESVKRTQQQSGE
ncbi:TM2 domain-containing protein [Synechococcus sp. HK01-R]|uniref:TM2 domain-containing protein n=1 Tax=Synechococcus sp. HK01-R TaxID=2751171 RepID=UPI001C896470|nr:TM2 domain-containing protein [Synechococcus sp. HK01-R]